MTINGETINKYKSLNDNTLNELIELFLQSTPLKLRKMLESFYLKDFPSVRIEAHEISGNASMIGADILAELTSEIEFAKQDPLLEEYLHERVIKAHKEFDLIKIELKNISNQLS